MIRLISFKQLLKDVTWTPDIELDLYLSYIYRLSILLMLSSLVLIILENFWIIFEADSISKSIFIQHRDVCMPVIINFIISLQ